MLMRFSLCRSVAIMTSELLLPLVMKVARVFFFIVCGVITMLMPTAPSVPIMHRRGNVVRACLVRDLAP